jgi:hypothetical protein
MAREKPTLNITPIKTDAQRICAIASCTKRSRLVVNGSGYCEAHLTDLPEGVSIKVGSSSTVPTNLNRPCV